MAVRGRLWRRTDPDLADDESTIIGCGADDSYEGGGGCMAC